MQTLHCAEFNPFIYLIYFTHQFTLKIMKDTTVYTHM